MIIDLTKLTQNTINSIEFEQTINFDIESLTKVGIRKLDPVNVKGIITKNDIDIFHINLNIKGIMILPCSISLVDVPHEFNIEYDEDINDDIINLKIINNSLDIIPIVWENIVTEIPLRIVDPNIKENTIEEKKENQFNILKDLLKEKEDE